MLVCHTASTCLCVMQMLNAHVTIKHYMSTFLPYALYLLMCYTELMPLRAL